MTGRQVTQFLHSRSGGNLIVLLSVPALVVAWHFDALHDLSVGSLLGGVTGLVCGVAASILIALAMQLTNKQYNMLRSDTALPAALFMTMLTALPTLATSFTAGMPLALIMTAAAYLLFMTFGDSLPERKIFLLFTLLSALALTSVVYLYYLPIVLLGCVQMRIFSLKTLLAALIGIITPPWIVLGLGIVDINDIELPHLSSPSIDVSDPSTLTLLAVTTIVIIAGTGFMCANVLKVYSYNSRTRAFNGYYTLLFLASVLLSIIDFNNLAVYLPLLMAMTAYQASLMFGLRISAAHSWIGIVAFMALCWTSYVWCTWIL